MNKSTASKPDPAGGGGGLHKGAVTQPSGPGRAFKGLGVAKRYCRKVSMADSFVQDCLYIADFFRVWV